MLEAEVAEALATLVKETFYDDGTEFSLLRVGETVSENAGFLLVGDDEKFLVTVTRIEEGQ